MNSTPATRRSNRIAENKTDIATTDNSLPNGTQNSELYPFSQPEQATAQDDNAYNGQSAEVNGLGRHTRSSQPVAMLEEDPNSHRKKRRKVDDVNATTSEKDVSTANERTLDTSLPHEQEQASLGNTLEPTITSYSNGPTTIEGAYNSDYNHSSEPSVAAQEGLLRDESDDKSASHSAAHGSSKPKTIKLNSNGKLLSSPSRKEEEKGPSKKPGGKTQKRQGEKKLVIHYGAGNATKDRVGRLIDDIINGRPKDQKPTIQEPVAKPAAASVGSEKPRPKPTHPFFMKRSLNKTETPSSSRSDYSVSGTGNQKEDMDIEAACEESKRSYMSFLSSNKRGTKFPEPVDPLWPPRDLVHVGRGESAGRPRVHNASSILERNQKKNKTTTTRVTNEEDVLLLCLRDAQSAVDERQLSPAGTVPEALRVPGKHVTSPQVLREAMVYELSGYYPGPSANKRVLKELSHPALAKLTSSMANSMTPFDYGEFETQLWCQKYAPNAADEVLQVGQEALVLRDWLKYLMVTAVETGKPSKDDERKPKKDNEKKSKKRRKPKDLDDFIVSSEDEAFEPKEVSDSEDELAGGVTTSFTRTTAQPSDMPNSSKTGTEKSRASNVIILSGPPGCGKTASVYAVAKEMGFEVFEVNPGNRRSARDLLERVGDMTQNHLVRTSNRNEDDDPNHTPDSDTQVPFDEGKQNKMMSFFKPLSTKSTKKNSTKACHEGFPPKTDLKHLQNQKQSLILLEEADILFEDDKQFWSGVMNLIDQSKRPIVITCNDESLIPLEDLSFHAILRYQFPPSELVVDYLLLAAATEGHMLKREAVADLYLASGLDLRRSVMELNFWCQMGVGSEKAGIDWIIDRWPLGSNVDENGQELRMTSLNTYDRFMGWFSRDMVLDSNHLNREVELGRESLDWWQVGVQNSETLPDLAETESCHSRPESLACESGQARLDAMCRESDHADMRSVLDTLSVSCSLDLQEVRTLGCRCIYGVADMTRMLLIYPSLRFPRSKEPATLKVIRCFMRTSSRNTRLFRQPCVLL